MTARVTGGCLSCDADRLHAHGLCKNCYDRARYQGTHTNYPACGAVPVPYLGWGGPEWAEHPDIPTGYVSPAQLGCRPNQHAILPGGHALARHLYEDAEAYARCWLNARRQRAA